MKPAPAPNVDGNTPWERFDNAMRTVLSVPKEDVLKEEANPTGKPSCEVKIMTYREYVEAYNMLIEELQSIIKDTPRGLKTNPNDPIARDLMARHKKVSEDMVSLTGNYFSEQDEE